MESISQFQEVLLKIINMWKILLFVLVVLSISCCSGRKDDKRSKDYFKSGDLSRDEFLDSLRNKRFSEIFFQIKENSFHNLPKEDCSYRLLVVSSIYNPYCIRMDRSDSLMRVTVKIAGDRKNFVRAGLSNLTLIYESKHKRMEVLFDSLLSSFNKYDFYSGFDEAKGFVVADGTSYLLERSCNGEYNVVVGRDGGSYKGKDELFAVVEKMHTLIPGRLLPDLANARELEDVLFSPLKKDTEQNSVKSK